MKMVGNRVITSREQEVRSISQAWRRLHCGSGLRLTQRRLKWWATCPTTTSTPLTGTRRAFRPLSDAEWRRNSTWRSCRRRFSHRVSYILTKQGTSSGKARDITLNFPPCNGLVSLHTSSLNNKMDTYITYVYVYIVGYYSVFRYIYIIGA